jgi:hypothetical protein
MIFAGVVVGVVVLGLLLGFLGSGGSRLDAPVVPEAGSSAAVAADVKPASFKPEPKTNVTPAPAPSVLPPGAGTSPAPAPLPLITNWEDKLDEILVSSVKEDEKARKLLEMFPRLPPDGQVEIAQHLSNLVSDQDYPALERLLTNTALPEAVLTTLLNDALNRPNSLKLPALLDVARDPQNPKAREAKDILQLFLEEDYGTDWALWQTKVDQWLRDNPD